MSSEKKDNGHSRASKPGAVSVPADEAARLDERIAEKRASAKKPPSAQLTQLEQDVVTKQRARDSKPGAYPEQLSALEGEVVAKQRAIGGSRNSAFAPGAHAELQSLEDAVTRKTRQSTAASRSQITSLEDAVSSKIRNNGGPQTATPGVRAELSSLEDAVARKTLREAHQQLEAMEADLSAKETVRGGTLGELEAIKNSSKMVDAEVPSMEKKEQYPEQAPKIMDIQVPARDPLMTVDAGVSQQPDVEYGVYGAPGLGLAVAVAVEDEDSDAYIPSAVEYDPDAKPPIYRNRRFRLYAFMAFVVLIVVAVGAAVGVVISKGGSSTVAAGLPTMAPTSYREGLGIRAQLERVVGSDILDDPESPYNKAMQWITYSDPLMLDPTDSTFLQRYLAAYFYYATSVDEPWRSCNPPKEGETDYCSYQKLISVLPSEYQSIDWTRWLSGANECAWAGIFCDDEGQIRAIDLNGNALSGSFPSGLVYLPFLQSLSLGWSNLRGTLPVEVINMKHLVNLELHYNMFTGTIPIEWWKTRNVVRINVANNDLNGTIPSEINLLKDLKGLFLYENRFEGQLPEELGDLKSLTYCRLYQNLFEGHLPENIGGLENLDELWLHRNNFNGSIPASMGDLQLIRDFRVHYNHLSGEIPDAFWSINPNIVRMDLYENQLSGTISTLVGNLVGLNFFRIPNNHFSGQLPSQLALLTNLYQLWVYGNDFTGSIPSELCALRDSTDHSQVLVEVSADCSPTGNLSAEVSCATGCCTKCCDATGTCTPVLN